MRLSIKFSRKIIFSIEFNLIALIALIDCTKYSNILIFTSSSRPEYGYSKQKFFLKNAI